MKKDIKLIILGMLVDIPSIAMILIALLGCKNAFYFVSPGTFNLWMCILNILLVIFTWILGLIGLVFGFALISSGSGRDIDDF